VRQAESPCWAKGELKAVVCTSVSRNHPRAVLQKRDTKMSIHVPAVFYLEAAKAAGLVNRLTSMSTRKHDFPATPQVWSVSSSSQHHKHTD